MAGICSAHMTLMETTALPESRTYKAAIAFVASSRGHRTIVMPSGGSWVSQTLLLTEVTVRLRRNEVFIVTSGHGETSYERDLEDALEFARKSGSEGTPDAIQILVPAIDRNGLSAFNLHSIHDRAVAAS